MEGLSSKPCTLVYVRGSFGPSFTLSLEELIQCVRNITTHEAVMDGHPVVGDTSVGVDPFGGLKRT